MFIAKIKFYLKTGILAKCTEGVLALLYGDEKWESVMEMRIKNNGIIY